MCTQLDIYLEDSFGTTGCSSSNISAIYHCLCAIPNFCMDGGEIRPFVRLFQDQFQPALEYEDFTKNIEKFYLKQSSDFTNHNFLFQVF